MLHCSGLGLGIPVGFRAWLGHAGMDNLMKTTLLGFRVTVELLRQGVLRTCGNGKENVKLTCCSESRL